MDIMVGASSVLAIAIDFGKMTKWIPTFIDGTIVTIVLSLLTVVIGCILGLIATLMKRSHMKALNVLGAFYTQVIR